MFFIAIGLLITAVPAPSIHLYNTPGDAVGTLWNAEQKRYKNGHAHTHTHALLTTEPVIILN